MSTENLTEIFELFGYGLMIGGLLSAMAFIVGYTINFVFNNLTK